MSCLCGHRHWHKRETAKAAWCPEHGVYLHARGLPFQGKRRKRNGYVDLAPRPLIAAANVKTRRSKLLLTWVTRTGGVSPSSMPWWIVQQSVSIRSNQPSPHTMLRHMAVSSGDNVLSAKSTEYRWYKSSSSSFFMMVPGRRKDCIWPPQQGRYVCSVPQPRFPAIETSLMGLSDSRTACLTVLSRLCHLSPPIALQGLECVPQVQPLKFC